MNDELIEGLRNYCCDLADKYFSNHEVILELKKRIRILEEERDANINQEKRQG